MATFRKIEEQNFLEVCADGTFDEVSKMIESGVSLDGEDTGGFNALENAARFNRGNIKVIKLLLKYCKDINHQGKDGATALSLAAGFNTSEIVKLLIDVGANMNLARDDGITALMGAANRNTLEVVTLLLTSGANVNAKASNGMTALLYAAMNNNDPKVIDALIEAGADDVQSNNGDNALILAARWNVPEVVEALLKAGANAVARNSENKTAYDYSLENEKLKNTDIPKKLKGVLNLV